MKKLVISTLLLFAAILPVTAQHYLQVGLSGGIGTLQYAPVDGTSELGLGGNVGVKYNYMFNERFGVAAGVQGSLLHGEASFSYASEMQRVHPDNGEDYTLQVRADNLVEHQRAILLSVPLQAVYRVEAGHRWTFQAAAGVDLLMPILGAYTSDGGTYTTKGFFPSVDQQVYDLENHGFSTTGIDGETDIDYKPFAVALCADAGLLYQMSRSTEIYFGLFVDYGLTNIIEAKSQELIDLGTYNGSFNSNRVDAVHPMQAGIKLAVRFGLGMQNVKYTKF